MCDASLYKGGHLSVTELYPSDRGVESVAILGMGDFLARKEFFVGVGCFTVIAHQDTEMKFGFEILKISPTVSEIALPIPKNAAILPL